MEGMAAHSCRSLLIGALLLAPALPSCNSAPEVRSLLAEPQSPWGEMGDETGDETGDEQAPSEPFADSSSVGNSIDAMQLRKNRLASASAAILDWERQERVRMGSNPVESGALFRLPIDSNSPMVAWHSYSPTHHYGRRTLNFEVRRAAQFVKLMTSGVAELRAGDVSDPDGSTPRDPNGALRHPAGSHINGYSVDLSYLGEGVAPTRLAEIDLEATSWLFYALLQSRAVISILTAYRDALVAQAEEWYDSGVI